MPESLIPVNMPELFARRAWQARKVLGLILPAVPGAMARKMTVEFDCEADFNTYKTFAIREGRWKGKNLALNSDLVKKRMEADIARVLGKTHAQVEMIRRLMDIPGYLPVDFCANACKMLDSGRVFLH